MLTYDEETPPQAEAVHRSAELTRPLRVGRLVIISAAAVTAGMFGMLGLGIGRDSLGLSPKALPGRIELKSGIAGRSASASLDRQIAITPDGEAIVFTMESERGDDALAIQQVDGEAPVAMGRRKPDLAPAAVGPGMEQMIDRNRKTLVIRPRPGQPSGQAAVRDAKTGRQTQIVSGDILEMRYAAGHLVYVRPDGSLWAAPFDEKTARMTSPPVQIASDVALTGTGIAQFAVSKKGDVAYLPEGPRSLVLVSREGRLRPATAQRRDYGNPRFAPDGKRISADFTDTAGRDIWTVTSANGALDRATFLGDAHDAVWTPDGISVTYTSFRLGALGIYRSRLGSRTPPDSVFTSQTLAYSGEWLQDGSGLVTIAANLAPRSGLDIAFIANGGRGPLDPVVVNQFETRFPVVSPDGKWLAYVSNESGRDEVYIRPWKEDGAAVLVSDRGGTEPVWSPDGSEVFYRNPSSHYLVAASIQAYPRLAVWQRRALFPVGDMAAGFTHANYDISPDGSTFVFVRRTSGSPVTVLRNVPEMLKGADTKPNT